MKQPFSFSGFWRKLKITLLVIFAFLCGFVAGNIDRLDSGFFSLLQYQGFLPRQWQRFLPGGNAAESTAATKEELSGRIVRVYDGDTATLLSSDSTKKYKIRFFGIDAPESSQEFGKDSQSALAEKILGHKVKVLVVNTDRYGRNVGKVYRDGRYINLEMVTGGYAWYYRDYARNEKDLEEAERSARASRKGLWQSHLSPQPPWQYRKKGEEKTASSSGKNTSNSFFSLFR